MGHVDRDVGTTNYNPDGFSKKLLVQDVNAIQIDISMIRRPFEDAKPCSATHLADRRVAVAQQVRSTRQRHCAINKRRPLISNQPSGPYGVF